MNTDVLLSYKNRRPLYDDIAKVLQDDEQLYMTLPDDQSSRATFDGYETETKDYVDWSCNLQRVEG